MGTHDHSKGLRQLGQLKNGASHRPLPALVSIGSAVWQHRRCCDLQSQPAAIVALEMQRRSDTSRQLASTSTNAVMIQRYCAEAASAIDGQRRNGIVLRDQNEQVLQFLRSPFRIAGAISNTLGLAECRRGMCKDVRGSRPVRHRTQPSFEITCSRLRFAGRRSFALASCGCLCVAPIRDCICNQERKAGACCSNN